ncbi:hypothetical protein GGS24DRAFT_511781 [Hypoxylon argillaceum]|nr:hypothetical protein GGS24DRAFT_511781 [Hypoxylon argillaceum]
MASDASDTSDASDASSEVEEIILNPDSDATIAVFMITDDSTEEVQFHVSSRIVRELELRGDKPEIRLGTHVAASITSVGLLLSGMEANGNTDTLPPEFFALPIVDVWRVLTLVDVTAVRHYRPGCYRVPCSILAAWFTKWFQTQSPGFSQRDEYEQLLYPAFAFGIPAVFAAVTEWLAYDVASQIREQNPLREEEELPFRPYRDMHVPKEVIRVVRGAKAALRDRFIRLLDRTEQKFIYSGCWCRIQGLANVTEALLVPYGTQRDMLDHTALRDVLHFLSTQFKYKPPVNSECDICSVERVEMQVKGGAHDVARAFQGICLTCMDLSLNKPHEYEPKPGEDDKHAEACSWHGDMTWKHSDLRPRQPGPRQPELHQPETVIRPSFGGGTW